MTGNSGLPPPVLWAQRKSVIFLTFCVEDCKDANVKIENDKISFKGTGGTEKKEYENTIELFKQVNAEKSKYFVRDRVIDVILVKSEDGPFWPALLKNKVKAHWLKVDFSRWKDEDDTDDEGDVGGGKNPELEDMMRQMGGMGGFGGGGGAGGMPGMEGMGMGGMGGDRPSLDDLEDDSDSDDDDLPDLE